MKIKKKLLDLVRDKIRFKHYSFSTEKTYIHWIKHYILFHHNAYDGVFGHLCRFSSDSLRRDIFCNNILA